MAKCCESGLHCTNRIINSKTKERQKGETERIRQTEGDILVHLLPTIRSYRMLTDTKYRDDVTGEESLIIVLKVRGEWR